jgi:hypothetical protein
VIVSDVMKGGENSQKFIQALSSKAKDKSPEEKLTKNFSENIKYYCLITTSFCGEGEPFNSTKNAIPSIFTIILISFGLILAGRALKKETDPARKNFLVLLFFWMGIFFIFTFPVSFQLRPRFFILVFAVPFILSGILFDFFRKKWPSIFQSLVLSFAAAILISNIYGTTNWFYEMQESEKRDVEVNRTLILKNQDGVTLSQLEKAADFIYDQRKNGRTIYFYVKPEHVSPLKYILSEKNDSELNYQTLSLNEDPLAQYFAIIPSHLDPKKNLEEKYEVPVDILSKKECGQINVYEIDFPQRQTSREFRFNKKYSKTDRLFWKDAFGIKKDSIEEIEENQTEDIDMNE